MRFLGAFSIISAALLAWRAYRAYLIEELAFVRAFLGALEDYRRGVGCYLEPLSGWADSYLDERLSAVGFLDRLREGDAGAAYKAVRNRCYLQDKVDEILNYTFSRLGAGYLEGELTVLDDAIARLSREEKRIAEELSKRQKVAGALLGAFAVGAVILVI